MGRKFQRLVHRDVPVEWERRLAELSPPRDPCTCDLGDWGRSKGNSREHCLTWHKIIHEPGYPWEPIDRFIIYEMIPGHAIQPDVLAELQGTPPTGYWDDVREEYVVTSDTMITTRAWHLFQKYRCLGRPYWVIQGTRGGHKRWFSETEQKALRAVGMPSHPAPPGELPFAPFDERVVHAFMQQDLLRKADSAYQRRKKLSIAGFRARKTEEEQRLRDQLVKSLMAQVIDVAPDVYRSLVKMDAPRVDIDDRKLTAQQEQAEHSFIETGRVGGSLVHH